MPEIRCPKHRSRLLLKVTGHVKVEDGMNLIEIACRDCRNERRDAGEHVQLVLHRFNVGGELVETEVVPFRAV